jgi:hypothetical protein
MRSSGTQDPCDFSHAEVRVFLSDPDLQSRNGWSNVQWEGISHKASGSPPLDRKFISSQTSIHASLPYYLYGLKDVKMRGNRHKRRTHRILPHEAAQLAQWQVPCWGGVWASGEQELSCSVGRRRLRVGEDDVGCPAV